MTQSDPATRISETEHRRTGPLLPLVSVVIVNYNYGRFLEASVESVYAQTYPRVECVIVDNASTDGSALVIAACRARYASLRLIERVENGGQSVACLDGLRATTGPYVVFLDADDYLLPHCIERHIQVHLSSRVHAGFTSGDSLQMKGDDVVLSTNESIATFVRKLGPNHSDGDLLRPTPAGLMSLWETFDEALLQRVRLVPRQETSWVWSPTSGNCFRRDALDLLCEGVALGTLRSQTDLYLAVGINVVCGSILVDEPVFVYRLHGDNVFSSRPQLAGRLAFDSMKTEANTRIARSLLLEHFVKNARSFVQYDWQVDSLLGILSRLDIANPMGKARWQRKSMLLTVVIRYFPEFAKVVGKGQALRFLARRGLPPVILWRLSRLDRAAATPL